MSSGWEILAYVEKPEVGYQEVVAIFSIYTSGSQPS